MKHLHADPQSFTERFGTDGHHHELLRVDGVGCMSAAVQDVHHRHGQHVRHGPAEVAIQRQAGILGGGAGDREGDRENGVRAQVTLVGCAVEIEHRVVDRDLIFGREALEPRADHFVHVLDRLEHAFAAEAFGIAIAQLHGFVLAGGRATGHGGRADGATREGDVRFNCGVAATIEDFARVDGDDGAHLWPEPYRALAWRATIAARTSSRRRSRSSGRRPAVAIACPTTRRIGRGRRRHAPFGRISNV